MPVDVGVEAGLFKKHNLDIQIANFSGEARTQQGMAADSIDIALGSGPGLVSLSRARR